VSAPPPAGWHEANQRYLVAALAVVAERLRRRDEAAKGPSAGELERALREAEGRLPAPSALSRLVAAFSLSPFERDVLLLCAGVELDAQVAALCAAAQGDPRRIHPSFGLLLAALPGAHWSAVTPAGPLRRHRLVELGSGDSLTSAPIAAAERVLHFLAGVGYVDERLQGVIEPVVPARGELPGSQRAAVQRIVELWSGDEPWPVIHLAGSDPASKRAVASAACAAADRAPYALRAADLPAAAGEREGLLRLWERESRLLPGALLVDAEDVEGPGPHHLAEAAADRLDGPVLVASRSPVRLNRRATARIEIARPTPAEQRALWREALGASAPDLADQIEAAVGNFDMSARSIADAAREAAGRRAPRLWEVCRTRARPALDDLAQRIEPSVRWDDLVLPAAQRAILQEIILHVRHRHRVYERWGFGSRASRGLGVSALFAGASGTGKTMAAEVIARAIDLDLYRIDLSQVVNKFVGETEKNLRRIFDAAEEGAAILLFDEADALFGKRSEVRDSHDRYANIEVSYLLQRMEVYHGLAILTTNMKAALDQAFLRRLRFVVTFPFPDSSQRADIWRRAFPEGSPTDGLDIEKLARLSVPGGNIRNIALSAAFLAADAGEPVRMAHLLSAARAEYGKLERPLTDAEVGGWT
jgi:ATP-dependent 26S proteasome regulatory subunit